MTDAEKALDRLYEYDDRKHFQSIRDTYQEIRAAIKSQEKPAEVVSTTSLCMKILETKPDKAFGTWHVMDVIRAIKNLGFKIIDGGK